MMDYSKKIRILRLRKRTLMTTAEAEKAYQALMDSIRTVLETEIPEEGAHDFVGMELLLHPEKAQALFHPPVDVFRTAILKELTANKFRGDNYAAALYDADASEADIADAAADLAFVQMERMGAQSRRQLADESEDATAFILSVYTAFARLQRGKTDAAGFRSLFDRAWQNYFLHFNSRSVRRFYDKSWASRYSPSALFYPLG